MVAAEERSGPLGFLATIGGDVYTGKGQLARQNVKDRKNCETPDVQIEVIGVWGRGASVQSRIFRMDSAGPLCLAHLAQMCQRGIFVAGARARGSAEADCDPPHGNRSLVRARA